jgi:hypothetical protein
VSNDDNTTLKKQERSNFIVAWLSYLQQYYYSGTVLRAPVTCLKSAADNGSAAFDGSLPDLRISSSRFGTKQGSDGEHSLFTRVRV